MNYRTLFLASMASMLALSASPLANAKNIYVAQTAVGSTNGGDAADAYALSWLNTPGNWGGNASTVMPGDTVHLVGTFTSPLVVQGSGGPGSPVTIFFEPGANFTSPCWPASGAITINGQSWIVVDGGSNGLIQNINNGTSLGLQNPSRGIGGSGNGTAILYNSVIQNLTITNIYKKIKGNLDATRDGYCIDVSGSSITISNCAVSDGDGGLSYSATGVTQSNIFILKNTLLNCNHTIVIGIGDHNCYLTNLVIAGNYLDHWDVWDCPGNTPIHLDGIILFNDAYDQSSVMDGTRIYNNTFGGYVGTRTTAAIFTDLGCAVRNYFIFNNFFKCFPPGSWGNGFIDANGSNVWVANNTCIGTVTNGQNFGGSLTIGGDNAHVYNNVLIGCSGISLGETAGTNSVSSSNQGTNDLVMLNAYFANIWSDYNVLNSAGLGFQFTLTDSIGNPIWLSGIIGPNFLDWQTWYENEWGNGSLGNSPLVPGLFTYAQIHCDPHSFNRMPVFVPGAYVPAANDPVTITRGTNLYWLGITNDFNGNPRPTSGNWTIGAYEVVPANGPAPTIALTASSSDQTTGYLTLSWSSVNATNVTISGLGTVPLTGSTNIPVTTSTSYIATASGLGGVSSTTASATVQVSPPSGLRTVQP